MVPTMTPCASRDLPHFYAALSNQGRIGKLAESVEGAPLLREYVPKGHQGFESLTFRQFL